MLNARPVTRRRALGVHGVERFLRESFGESLVSADYAKQAPPAAPCRTCGELHDDPVGGTCTRDWAHVED